MGDSQCGNTDSQCGNTDSQCVNADSQCVNTDSQCVNTDSQCVNADSHDNSETSATCVLCRFEIKRDKIIVHIVLVIFQH